MKSVFKKLLYILPCIVVLFSCDETNEPNVSDIMPKGFTNDSIRIVSVVPYADTTITYNASGSSWTNEEWFLIKNYGSKPIDLFSYKNTLDSIWDDVSKQWLTFPSNSVSESGWFIKANNWMVYPKWTKRYFGRILPQTISYQSYLIEPKGTLQEKTPAVIADKDGNKLGTFDFLNREGDTLYLYKYNKTDTVLVDMIWWKNAQRNQVFYHQ